MRCLFGPNVIRLDGVEPRKVHILYGRRAGFIANIDPYLFNKARQYLNNLLTKMLGNLNTHD